MLRCRDVMKEEVYFCRAKDSIYRAAEVMAAKGIGFLPVVDGMRRLVGVLTDRDLVIRMVAKKRALTTPVEEAMTREVIACRALDPLVKAEELMAKNRKSRMPIIDEFGECVGIISLSDIAHATKAEEAGALLERVTEREAHAPIH